MRRKIQKILFQSCWFLNRKSKIDLIITIKLILTDYYKIDLWIINYESLPTAWELSRFSHFHQYFRRLKATEALNHAWILEQRSNRIPRTMGSRALRRTGSGKSNESSKHSNESKSLTSQNRRVRARELDELLATYYMNGDSWEKILVSPTRSEKFFKRYLSEVSYALSETWFLDFSKIFVLFIFLNSCSISAFAMKRGVHFKVLERALSIVFWK